MRLAVAYVSTRSNLALNCEVDLLEILGIELQSVELRISFTALGGIFGSQLLS